MMFDTYHPHAFMHDPYARRVREPPRAPVPRVPEPRIATNTRAASYEIVVEPPAGHEIVDATASLEQSALIVQGTIVKQNAGKYVYQTRGRAGVYAEPDERALLGVLPAGQQVTGGAPTRHGWIALDDDESWMLDDGSLALVARPSPSRPSDFAKRVNLPRDAELRKAVSEARRAEGGGLVVTVPRARRAAEPAARPVPVHVNPPRAPAAAPKPAPPSAPAAKKPAPSAKPAAAATSRGAEESARAAHKRKVSERRGLAEELAALHGEHYEGPVLTELDASEAGARHVQSPREPTEEWTALAGGGFVKGELRRAEADVAMGEALINELNGGGDAPRAGAGKRAEVEDDDDDDLDYWGF